MRLTQRYFRVPEGHTFGHGDKMHLPAFIRAHGKSDPDKRKMKVEGVDKDGTPSSHEFVLHERPLADEDPDGDETACDATAGDATACYELSTKFVREVVKQLEKRLTDLSHLDGSKLFLLSKYLHDDDKRVAAFKRSLKQLHVLFREFLPEALISVQQRRRRNPSKAFLLLSLVLVSSLHAALAYRFSAGLRVDNLRGMMRRWAQGGRSTGQQQQQSGGMGGGGMGGGGIGGGGMGGGGMGGGGMGGGGMGGGGMGGGGMGGGGMGGGGMGGGGMGGGGMGGGGMGGGGMGGGGMGGGGMGGGSMGGGGMGGSGMGGGGMGGGGMGGGSMGGGEMGGGGMDGGGMGGGGVPSGGGMSGGRLGGGSIGGSGVGGGMGGPGSSAPGSQPAMGPGGNMGGGMGGGGCWKCGGRDCPPR
ncbi:unnamed protein product [Closterium sp. Yama58-4]|nr:unnamed protein product [Closterium sp. Yama58-4]